MRLRSWVVLGVVAAGVAAIAIEMRSERRALLTLSGSGDGSSALPVEGRRLAGVTPFVRRLAAGEELAKLSSGSADQARFEELRPALLHADGLRRLRFSPHHDAAARYARTLAWLTEPPRERSVLHLTHEGAVRVWTFGHRIPRGEVRRAAENLDYVADVAGFRPEAAFDVLCTPRFGRELFPHQHVVPWASGVYHLRDRYCTVRATLYRGIRREVIKHQLIHACCDRLSRKFHDSRLVSEGLAEYLRHCRPGDRDPGVAVGRMADSFAALHERLELLREYGVEIGRIDPARLADLSPRQFFALRSVSYLLTQAMIAFIGPGPITRSLEQRSPGPILRAVRAIHWRNFLDFVARHSPNGNSANVVVVDDAGPPEGHEWNRTAAAALEALEWAGAPVDRDAAPPVEILELDAHSVLVSFPRVRNALLHGSGAVDVLADPTRTMWRPERFRDSSARRPIDWVESLCRSVSTVALAPIETTAYDPLAPARWLRHSYDRVILCLATPPDAVDPTTLEASYRAILDDETLPRTILVVDLAESPGHAAAVAAALTRVLPRRSRVAYWDPVRR